MRYQETEQDMLTVATAAGKALSVLNGALEAATRLAPITVRGFAEARALLSELESDCRPQTRAERHADVLVDERLDFFNEEDD